MKFLSFMKVIDMKHLKDIIINEEWENELRSDIDNNCHIIQESQFINPSCLLSNIGSSYFKHIIDIYERLGESIFRKEKLEKHPDIEFIKILKTSTYTPEAPSAQIFFNDKLTRAFIEEQCKSMNYNCSKIFKTTSRDDIYGELYVQINPNKPTECSNKIMKESGGLIIHLTSEFGKDKILKEGIVPKTPSKNIRPEQIYFLSPTNDCLKTLEEFCVALSDNRSTINNKRREVIKNKKILKWLIDKDYFNFIEYAIVFNIKDLKKHRKISFYEDTTTPGYPAYWTSEVIPKECIIDIIKVK